MGRSAKKNLEIHLACQLMELETAALDDPDLERLLAEWQAEDILQHVKFGNFMVFRYFREWQAAHHYGFRQGVEAAVRMRNKRAKRETKEKVPKLIWATLVFGALGAAISIPLLIHADHFAIRFVAALLAAPMLMMQALSAIFILSEVFRKEQDPYAENIIEYDPDTKNQFLEDAEHEALMHFAEHFGTVAPVEYKRDM